MSGDNKIMPYVFPLFLVIIFILYYLVDPSQINFPIQCPWRLLTGAQCPACGMQRALHSLLHGDFYEALRFNYFFVFSIPYALLAIISTWYNINHVFDKLRAFVYHRNMLKSYIVLYFCWWIIRNVYNI